MQPLFMMSFFKLPHLVEQVELFHTAYAFSQNYPSIPYLIFYKMTGMRTSNDSPIRLERKIRGERLARIKQPQKIPSFLYGRQLFPSEQATTRCCDLFDKFHFSVFYRVTLIWDFFTHSGEERVCKKLKPCFIIGRSQTVFQLMVPDLRYMKL